MVDAVAAPDAAVVEVGIADVPLVDASADPPAAPLIEVPEDCSPDVLDPYNPPDCFTPFCSEAGAPVPFCPWATRGEGVCDLALPEPVYAYPADAGFRTFDVRTLPELLAAFDIERSETVAPARQHTLECWAAVGCPERVAEYQNVGVDLDLDFWRVPRSGVHAVLTPSGRLLLNTLPPRLSGVTTPGALLTSFDPSGQLEWSYATPLSFTLTGDPGGESAIIVTPAPDLPAYAACRTWCALNEEMRVIGPDGQDVWWRALPSDAAQWRAVGNNGEIWYTTGRGDYYRHWEDELELERNVYTALHTVSVATGETIGCVDDWSVPMDPLNRNERGRMLTGDGYYGAYRTSAYRRDHATGDRFTYTSPYTPEFIVATIGQTPKTLTPWDEDHFVYQDYEGFVLLRRDTLEEVRRLVLRNTHIPTWSDEIEWRSYDQFIVDHQQRIWATVDGDQDYIITDAFGDAPHIHPLGASLNSKVLAEDGTIIVRGSSEILAFSSVDAPDSLRLLWAIQMDVGWGARPLLREDGVLVVTSVDGVVSWWQTPHGGLAHTPSPTYLFNMQRSGRAPDPPYAQAPERERTWRWPEELEGSGEGSGDGSGDG